MTTKQTSRLRIEPQGSDDTTLEKSDPVGRAARLQIPVTTKPRKRPTRVIWTKELVSIMVDAFRAGGPTQAKEAVRRYYPGLSGQCILKKLTRLGLREPSKRPRTPLDSEERTFLVSHVGNASVAWMASMTGRSRRTILSFFRSIGQVPDEQREAFQAKEVAILLGVEVAQVRRWIFKGYLWTERRRIPVEFLAALVVERPDLVAPEKLPEIRMWLRDLLKDSLPMRISLQPPEVARRLGVERATMARWIQSGWLPNKRLSRAVLTTFVREHPEELPYDSLSRASRNWLRYLGFEPIRKIRNQRCGGQSDCIG